MFVAQRTGRRPVRRRSSCRLFAGILATISLQAAHAALLQDVELDNAGAVRRAIDSGEATPNSLAREPGISILAAAARAGSMEVVRCERR